MDRRRCHIVLTPQGKTECGEALRRSDRGPVLGLNQDAARFGLAQEPVCARNYRVPKVARATTLLIRATQPTRTPGVSDASDMRPPQRRLLAQV